MSAPIHALDFLEKPCEGRAPGVCVVFGGELFLKRLVLKRLERWAAGVQDSSADGALMTAKFDGATAEWRDVVGELATVSLFGGGGRRVAVVEDASRFIEQCRDRLEQYVEKPRSTGVLILDVELWSSNMRLYKAITAHGMHVECRAPESGSSRSSYKEVDEGRVAKWLVAWGKSQYDIRLDADASRAMMELVGPEFGLLDSELAKLALFVAPGGKISAQLVRDVVGGWRVKTNWEMIDALADGDAAQALYQLDRLLHAGQEPIAIFGSIAWSLRRYAAATRIFVEAERRGRSISLQGALEQAGFKNWPEPNRLARAEQQLKQMGRERAGKIHRWLLETDLALKGSHAHADRARLVLEQLIVRMARSLGPRPAASGRRS